MNHSMYRFILYKAIKLFWVLEVFYWLQVERWRRKSGGENLLSGRELVINSDCVFSRNSGGVSLNKESNQNQHLYVRDGTISSQSRWTWGHKEGEDL